MSRPALTDVTSGQQGWDTTLNDDIAILRDGPLPIVEYANSGALPAAGSNDRCLAITTDTGTIYYSDGTNWRPLASIPFGAFGAVKAVGEQLTMSGATKTSTLQFPSGSYRLGALVFVDTAVTSGDGGTDMDIGDGTDVDLYGAAIAFTGGTQTTPVSRTAQVFKELTAAENVVITCNGGTFSGGVVTVVFFYIELSPPIT